MLLASGISCLTLFWKVLSSYQLLFLPHSLPSPLLVHHLNEYSVISIYLLCSIYLSLYGSFWIILTFQFTLFSLIVSNLLWNLSVEAFISVMFLVVISSSISVWFCLQFPVSYPVICLILIFYLFKHIKHNYFKTRV